MLYWINWRPTQRIIIHTPFPVVIRVFSVRSIVNLISQWWGQMVPSAMYTIGILQPTWNQFGSCQLSLLLSVNSIESEKCRGISDMPTLASRQWDPAGLHLLCYCIYTSEQLAWASCMSLCEQLDLELLCSLIVQVKSLSSKYLYSPRALESACHSSRLYYYS